MVSRLYVNNFRTLVNFEIKFEPTGLLLGANGSGKSTVFDVLRNLRSFVCGEARLADIFSVSDLTSWQLSNSQKFEIELDTNKGRYTYILCIEFFDSFTKSRIKEEKLTLEETTLFYETEGEAHLYNDSGVQNVTVAFDLTQSGVGLVQERKDNMKLSAFKKYMNRLIVVRPTPFVMEQYSSKEEKNISFRMENFSAWFRYLMQENPTACQDIFKELDIPGFVTLRSVEAGEQRVLKADFKSEEGIMRTYYFNSLSDGQKMLIAIYSIIIGNRDKGSCIFIDEPDNFISIREIQPWLRLFIDDCGRGESLEQVILISQHPEIIDYSPLESFIWFERGAEQYTRIKLIDEIKNEQVLPFSQLIARGYIK